jgi:Tfp pilus assembly protein PilN
MTDKTPDEAEKTAPDQSRTVVYLMGVVVVLLVVIVALVVIRSQSATTATTDAAAQLPAGVTAGGSMPGVGSSTQAEFDAKNATKVPAGTKPGDYVKAYYAAILAKEWAKAFKMQPATSQQGSTADQFKSTQEQYGMKSFKVASSTEKGDAATVVVQQDLGTNGKWGATWTFVKSDDGKTWLVKQRQVSMNP